MPQYNTILFDLDGTLVDSGLGITNSVIYALNQLGIQNVERTELYKFIGPPLINAFMEYYGFTKKQAQEALAHYRVFYNKKGIYQNTVYNGVKEMLETLKKNGKKIILATSKPEVMALTVLQNCDLLKFFDCITGATLDEKLCEKPDIIAYALKRNNITDLGGAIMVGDRHHDIEGAKVNKIASVGVLYGYGSLEELKNARADYIVDNSTSLLEILNK